MFLFLFLGVIECGEAKLAAAVTAAKGSVRTNETNSQVKQQIKENLKRESYQTFDGLAQESSNGQTNNETAVEANNRKSLLQISPSSSSSSSSSSATITAGAIQAIDQAVGVAVAAVPAVPEVATANRNEEETNSSTSSNKFVSTCQIEIKHSLKKNCISPTIKLIKVSQPE